MTRNCCHLALEMTLRKGVTFTNGEQFNAEAAAFPIDQFVLSRRYDYVLASGLTAETEAVGDCTVLDPRVRTAFFPGSVIFIAVFCFNYLRDVVREALDPVTLCRTDGRYRRQRGLFEHPGLRGR